MNRINPVIVSVRTGKDFSTTGKDAENTGKGVVTTGKGAANTGKGVVTTEKGVVTTEKDAEKQRENRLLGYKLCEIERKLVNLHGFESILRA